MLSGPTCRICACSLNGHHNMAPYVAYSTQHRQSSLLSSSFFFLQLIDEALARCKAQTETTMGYNRHQTGRQGTRCHGSLFKRYIIGRDERDNPLTLRHIKRHQRCTYIYMQHQIFSSTFINCRPLLSTFICIHPLSPPSFTHFFNPLLVFTFLGHLFYIVFTLFGTLFRTLPGHIFGTLFVDSFLSFVLRHFVDTCWGFFFGTLLIFQIYFWGTK